MKRLLILCALVMLVLPGCKKKPPADKAPEKGQDEMATMAAAMEVAMQPEARRAPPRRAPAKMSNLASVRAGFAAYNEGKLDDAVKPFTADSEWHNVGAPAPFNVLKGPEKIKAYFAMNKKVFPGKSVPTRIFDGGENVVVEAVSVGTHKADWMGVKASDKPIGLKVAYWFQMKDGQALKVYFYADSRVIMTQIGALKGKMAEGVTKALPEPTGEPTIIKGKADAKAMAAMEQMMKFKPTDKEYAKLVDENTVLAAANGREMKGLKANRKVYAMMSKMFTDMKITSQQGIGVGSWGIMRAQESFTSVKHKKSVQSHRLYIGDFAAGKLKYGIMYQNFLEVALQLGLVPKPGAKPGDKPGAKPGDKPGEKPAGMKASKKKSKAKKGE